MTKDFIPLQIALLTISDTREFSNDISGDLLANRITSAGHQLATRKMVVDNQAEIEAYLKIWIAEPNIHIVIATGGTGLTGRDVTPEAFEAFYEKTIPGFGELFRWLSYAKIGTSTIQSRATAGIANGTYLFALPGSPTACQDAWDMILQPQLDSRTKPCNFATLITRLKEK